MSIPWLTAVTFLPLVGALVIGFSLSVPFDLPSGPAIIAVSGVLVAVAWSVRRMQHRG